MKSSFAFVQWFVAIILLGFFSVQAVLAQATKTELPKEKQTTLGLYITSKEAYEKWKAAPEKVKILDVRTNEEYIYVGHASMAWNIPLKFQTFDWDPEMKHFKLKSNPDFLKHVRKEFQPDDIILVTCRSGGRSAIAVDQLAEAGFKNVYTITDGFEGDAITDPESVYFGQRLKNGWKNSGLPWTYSIDPKLVLISDNK